MKIGITCYSTYGGSGVVATELGKCLARRGHKVHFITRNLPFRLQKEFNQNIFYHNVEMMEYPLFGESPYPIVLASKMAEIVRAEELDLLHVHYAIPHATSAFLAQQMLAPQKIPIVTTLHGTDITLVGKDPSFFDITKFSIDKSTVVTAVSDFLKTQTEEAFQPKGAVYKVSNFVDPELFKQPEKTCRKMLGLSDDKVVFVHLSNFRPVKRSDDVIRIFEQIAKSCPEAHLLMVGEGPLITECRKLVDEFAIKDRVEFIGRQDDIVSVLGMCDVMLFPSEVESFGLAALEASSCRIPVIGSLGGGIPEAVEHEVTGYLYDVGDVESMACAGIQLTKDCDLRRKMGNAGRERVKKLFAPDKIIPQYEALYEEALKKV